jgi:hypothetical protein
MPIDYWWVMWEHTDYVVLKAKAGVRASFSLHALNYETPPSYHDYLHACHLLILGPQFPLA